MTEQLTRKFYSLAQEQKLSLRQSNLRFYLKHLFRGIDLNGKSFLDVGGGAGMLSYYAALSGASRVICLEPVSDGSNDAMLDRFNYFKTQLDAALPVELVPLTLQAYLPQVGEGEFDVVALHNSINHLDEEACIHLRRDPGSYAAYKNIFQDLYRIMKPGARLLVTDCSCKNFYHALGVKNYFAPTIEWHKHQMPNTWVSLLKEVGFKNPRIEWKSPDRLREPGRLIMGNAFFSYLNKSKFKFTMEK